MSGQLQNGKNLFGVGTDNRTDGGTGDWTNSDDDPRGSRRPFRIGAVDVHRVDAQGRHERDAVLVGRGAAPVALDHARPCTAATRIRTCCPQFTRSGSAGRSTRRAPSSSSCGSTRSPSTAANRLRALTRRRVSPLSWKKRRRERHCTKKSAGPHDRSSDNSACATALGLDRGRNGILMVGWSAASRPWLAPARGPGARVWRSRACVGSIGTRAVDVRRPRAASGGGERRVAPTQSACTTLSPGAAAAAPAHAVRIRQHRARSAGRHVEPCDHVPARPAGRRLLEHGGRAHGVAAPGAELPVRRRDARHHRGRPTCRRSSPATRPRWARTRARRSSSRPSASARSGGRSPTTSSPASSRSTRRTATAADYDNGIQSVIEAVLQSAPFLYRPEFGARAAARRGPSLPLDVVRDGVAALVLPLGLDARRRAVRRGRRRRARRRPTRSRRRRRACSPTPRRTRPSASSSASGWASTRSRTPPRTRRPTPTYTPRCVTRCRQETLAFADWVMWQSDAKLDDAAHRARVVRQRSRSPALRHRRASPGDALQQVQLDPDAARGPPHAGGRHGGARQGRPELARPARQVRAREALLPDARRRRPQNIVITPPRDHAGRLDARAVHEHSHGAALQRLPHADGSDRLRLRELRRHRPVADHRPGAAGRRRRARSPAATSTARSTAPSTWRTSSPQSAEVRDCVATEWFRYAMGRGEPADDACSLQLAQAVVRRVAVGHASSSSSPSRRRPRSATATR